MAKPIKVPVVMQMEALECGAASLAMILAYHGRIEPLITEFVAQRMRDAQQKGEISPDINTAMTSRLLLDLTYGVL